MYRPIPCLVSRDTDRYLAQQDRAEAAYEAASDELNRESPADLAARIADYFGRCPKRAPEGWDDMDTDELLAAVGDDDLLWDELVEEAQR